MLVTLGEAKAHLNVAGAAEDVTIARLVQAASDFFVRIGVEVVEPVPEPVRQATLMMVEGFYDPIRRDPAIRVENVEGVGSQAFHSPDRLEAARMQTISTLIAPYREWPV